MSMIARTKDGHSDQVHLHAVLQEYALLCSYRLDVLVQEAHERVA